MKRSSGPPSAQKKRSPSSGWDARIIYIPPGLSAVCKSGFDTFSAQAQVLRNQTVGRI
ncbi:hypothetical protein [Methanosarcina sp. DH2]|uniref:hypothetical protein n=1 Tax=Methanosarcina sp. DH2 TaxID=2605639 RepID=UPI001E31C13C|nr:hypothetical protein [Methanosarcina sp. DH2]